MRLLLLLFSLLRAVSANQRVLGFLGESVTLLPELSEALQDHASIKWLILANDTWIATDQGGRTKTDHFWRYSGRLHLDSRTGALTISRLVREDAMQYVIEVGYPGGREITHKVDLRVETRLQPPNVTTLFAASDNGTCNVAVRCSSPDPRANLTWSTAPATSHRTLASWRDLRSTFLLVELGSGGRVRFTCNATNALESVAGALVVECARAAAGGESTQEPTENKSHFGHGLALGSCLGVVLAMFTYLLRSKIEGALSCGTGSDDSATRV